MAHAAGKPTISFFGIGLMGKPMAINLLKAGYPVIAWNRTTAKAEALKPAGATIAATLADAAKADILITMLAAGPEVKQVLETIAGHIPKGSLVIDMSSTRQSEAQEINAMLEAHGVHFIDAPVSGGVVGAEAATLAIMAGGDPEQFERAKPILSVMGRPTLVGPAGCGQISKLCNQLIVGATLNIVAEALLLAEAGGADPASVRTAIRGGFAESKILEVHGQRMLDRNFMPGGQVKTQLKDLDNILDAANTAGIKLPVTELVTAHYREQVKTTPHADQSAVMLEVERINPGKRVGSAPDKLPD
ncbi:MAG: 2-hydroxy-3-oxopropionate reductase [Pseudomonadota bacterium]|jgi:2-hydroxy-3-oxopropionate reductase